MAKDMFDAGSNARAASVVGLSLSGQGLVARPLVVNLGAQMPGLERWLRAW